jgi:drug/metabolite transporter (DMT)-like permease
MRRLHADLVLLACAAIWGFAFLFQKSAMEHVGPFAFIAARSLVACLALAPLVVREAQAISTPGWAGLAMPSLVAGLAFFAGASFQQIGIITATITNTGFLTALYVVITPFVAWGLMGGRPSPVIWLAAAISFVGTWLLGGGTLTAFSRGDTLVAVSAAFWALHVVLLGRASMLGSPATFTALQFAVVGLSGLGCCLAFETVNTAALLRATPDIAYVGLLSSALTFTVFTVALRSTQPAEAAIIVSTETLFAALSAYAVLGERLSPIGWMGASAILAASLLVQLAQRTLPTAPGPSRSIRPGEAP